MAGVREWLIHVWKDRPRRRQMIVTDITRMEGQRVCVGGMLEDGTAVRPVVERGGPDEDWLRSARGAPVTPFTVVEFRVGRRPPRAQAPHTEDRGVPGNGHAVLRALDIAEQIALLERSAAPSVRATFTADIHTDPQSPWGRYVRAGTGARSLGTIRPARLHAVRNQHYPERGRWDYRLRFTDGSGEEFQLAVVDLAFRRRLDTMRDGGTTPEAAARAVLAELQRQRVYLRIGLARGWERYPDRCYLQITGVYGYAAGDG